MTKKAVIELLLRLHGLEPKDVHHYHTDSCGGQFENGIGWEGDGISEDGKHCISFANPEGFDATIYEIINTGRKDGIPLVYPS